MTEKQRSEALEYRRIQRYPKHSPPHFDFEGDVRYLITAACYGHVCIAGKSHRRMTECKSGVLAACEKYCSNIYAWCILPNHYHVLLNTEAIKALRTELGRFHGRTSHKWDGEDGSRGRQVWHNCFERRIRSAGHFFASLNYVLNNAVHHRYVQKWQDWDWSNAREYLNEMGAEKALEIWRKYPVLGFGKKWDIH